MLLLTIVDPTGLVSIGLILRTVLPKLTSETLTTVEEKKTRKTFFYGKSIYN